MPGHRTTGLPRKGHRPTSRALGAIGCLTVGGALLVGPAAMPAQAAPRTVVTLTFDDGNADVMAAVPILAQRNLKATFYIISGQVGAPGYVTRANLNTLKSKGHEIGGHTVTHPDLTTVPTDEAKRQVCNDRATLSGWGFTVKSFSYPYAAYDSAVENIVAGCGYNSARTLGDIASAHGCSDCDLSGSIPPADPYNIPAVDQIDTSWTLAQMQSVVTKAEKVGGWVPFTFHHVCSGSGCDSLNITPATLTSFVNWLAKRPTSTTVKTVDQVIGGPVKPLVPGPPSSSGTALQNPSLETAGSSGLPQCWMPGGYGSNTATWSRVADAHAGSYAERLTMSNYVSGDAKLLPTLDLGTCAPTVTAGRTYQLGAWYKSTAVSQFAVYYRDAAGAWYYWTSSPWFAAASSYTQATWTTPAVPAGATGISFGLSLFRNGTLTTDDYSITATGTAAAGVLASGTTKGTSASTPSTVPQVDDRGTAHPSWGTQAQPTLPGGRTVRPGQRVSVPLMHE